MLSEREETHLISPRCVDSGLLINQRFSNTQIRQLLTFASSEIWTTRSGSHITHMQAHRLCRFLCAPSLRRPSRDFCVFRVWKRTRRWWMECVDWKHGEPQSIAGLLAWIVRIGSYHQSIACDSSGDESKPALVYFLLHHGKSSGLSRSYFRLDSSSWGDL